MNHNKSGEHDEDLDDSLWDSPVKSSHASTGKHPTGTKSTYEEQRERDETLRQELQSVRQVNEAIEGVIQSLGKAKDNMKTVNNTVSAASTLLNTWTRILSQTEHNQRLILDPSWQGASQDIADIEEEALEKQRAAERREAEEEEKRRAAARRAEEEERRKAAGVAKPAPATSRGRGRPGATGRGSGAATSTSSSTSYVQVGGSAASTTNASGLRRAAGSTRRPTSGIGRGAPGRGARSRG